MMKTSLLGTVAVGSILALTAGCANDTGEETRSSEDGLAIYGTYTGGSSGGYKAPTTGVLDPDPGSSVCAPVRYDVRRTVRTCEGIPNVYIASPGGTYVTGTNGRWHITRPLAGTTASSRIQGLTCSYTWEPNGCADPDWSRLYLASNEKAILRTTKVVFKSALSSRRYPGYIPTAVGSCPTCGITDGSHMYAILPSEGTYTYTIMDASGTNTQYFLYTSDYQTAVDEDPLIVDVQLSSDVPEQDVLIQPW